MSFFPTQQQALFGETPVIPKGRIFILEVPGRMPSWNEILGMEQWARYKYKQQLADAFIASLRATANDCSTKTTSAKNTLLTYADTAERYLAMRREQRRLRSLSKKLDRKNQSAQLLKSSNSKVPF